MTLYTDYLANRIPLKTNKLTPGNQSSFSGVSNSINQLNH
jgi:hypothetical protein